MGWYEEQIKQRKLSDDELFSDSLEGLAKSITGNKEKKSELEISEDAIKDIIKYYGYKIKDDKIPEYVDEFDEQLEYLCRPFGLMSRRVKLTEGWYKDSIGALMGWTKEDNYPVAIIPDARGYKFRHKNRTLRVNKLTVRLLKDEGLCFYKPFPNKKLSLLDLLKYAFATRTLRDYIILIIFMIIPVGLGLIAPKITYFLYGEVIENKSVVLLFSTIIFYICLNISTMLFNTYKSMYNSIISSKMSFFVESATMMRVLSLPVSFFKEYSSGEISSRTSYVTSLTNTLMNTVFNTTLSSLFSLVYITSIFEYAPGLVIPSLVIIFVTIAFSIISTFAQMKISKQQMELSAKESGMSYAMINGVQKIKTGGAEKRAFSRWSDLYSKSVKLTYNPPAFIKFNGVITLIISLTGTIVMYFFALQTGVSLAEYSAFNSAYGMVFGAFSSIASLTLTFSQIKPIYEMAKPLLDCEPETSENKQVVTQLRGGVELNNISFRYDENMPNVIDNLSLKIKPNEYVAIVGKTGCGKSTLIRLMLGFENAQRGSIFYDGKDIKSLDLKSLRRKIGTVMQDGKLFFGDIYSNIVISAPQLTIDEAFEAADLAGIGDDIREMPMGMHTLITEGGGGISGGQKQRILIARAIAPKPKILIFDEATSALDNITQKVVCESLDSLNCTRIVIAHRLSTIKNCDRIIYLEDGKIQESGTYDELIKLNGKFTELVKRQMLEDN